MLILGKLKRRSVSRSGAAYAIAAITLIVVGLAVVLFLIDDEALIPEQQERLTESVPPRSIGDTDGFDTPSKPQRPVAAGRVEASEVTSAETLDPESTEVVRIPIPNELAAWVDEIGPDGLQFHEWLERQPRDAVWADSVEADYRDYINNNPDLSNIRALSIECRTNACEILAVGYGDAVYRAWLEMMSEVFSEEWLEERFEFPIGGGCGASPMAPGVLALHCIIQPGEPEVGQTEASEEEAIDVDGLSLSERMARLRERDSGLAELYQELQSEPTDPSWSVYMETQLSEFLTGHPELADSSIVSIECRTSLCEMQAVVPSLLNWGLVVPDFYAQAWHDLDIASVIGEPISSDQAGLIWILRRRESGDP